MMAGQNGAEVLKVSENAAKYPVEAEVEVEDSDSDATVADRIMELWVNAGGSDDRVQGLCDTEGWGGVPGVLGASLLRGSEGEAARGGAALRLRAIAESVGTEGLTTKEWDGGLCMSGAFKRKLEAGEGAFAEWKDSPRG